MKKDRRIRSAEVVEARLNLDRVRIQWEKTVAEQTLYSTVALEAEGITRRPLQDLVPVRLGNAAPRQGKADLPGYGRKVGRVYMQVAPDCNSGFVRD